MMKHCEYSRLDLAGEFGAQNESDGGENHHSGAHGDGVALPAAGVRGHTRGPDLTLVLTDGVTQEGWCWL